MSAEKRKKIFEIYSKNLSLLVDSGLIPDPRKKFKNSYLCPLCLEEFDETALDTSLKQHLTLEDAPPVSLGGRSNVLTCKRCNNTCGSAIDSHLTHRIRELDKIKFFANSEARVKVENAGYTVNGNVTISAKGGLQMEHRKENNNPETLEKFIKTVGKDTIINIKFASQAKVNDERLQLALLKTGYLIMFEKYGYALLFDQQYDRLREQINKPHEQFYPLDFWFLGPFPHEVTTIVPFVIEENLTSVLPFFELDSGKTKYIFGTILPINNKPIEETIKAFRVRFDQTSEFAVEMYKFGKESDFILDMKKARELIEFVRELN